MPATSTPTAIRLRSTRPHADAGRGLADTRPVRIIDGLVIPNGPGRTHPRRPQAAWLGAGARVRSADQQQGTGREDQGAPGDSIGYRRVAPGRREDVREPEADDEPGAGE